MNVNGIVAGGRRNLLKDAGTRQRIIDAVRKIKSVYADRMKAAGFIARARLWIERREEIRKAIETIAPRGGCYFKQ